SSGFISRDNLLITKLSNPRIGFISADTAYAILAGTIGIWLCWDALVFQLVTYSPYADYWEHTALLTEWLRNPSNPSNPHVLDSSLSPRYMPWFWLLTAVGGWFQFDSITLMGISAVVSYALIVIGIKLFFTEYFYHAWAPVIAFMVLFFGWGISWNWSNLYQLRSFFYVAGYPSSFVFGLSLISFWFTLKVLRREFGLALGAMILAILAAMMFLCHPLTGVFGISGCGLLVITQAGIELRQRAILCLGLLIGSFAVELWPYFSTWEVVLGKSGNFESSWAVEPEDSGLFAWFRSGLWRHPFYQPELLLVILGFGWFCVFGWIYLLFRRNDAFILLGGVAMLLPYFVQFFVSVPLAHRFLLFAMFFFHMAGVKLVLSLLDRWVSAGGTKAADTKLKFLAYSTFGIFGIAIVFNVLLLGANFTGKHVSSQLRVVDKFALIPNGENIVELYKKLTPGIGPNDVVIAPLALAWPLPTVTGKAVVAYHQNPLLMDQFQRLEVIAEFFAPDTVPQRRDEIIQTYEVKYMLLEGSAIPDSFMRWTMTVAEPIASVGSYTMYRLLPKL
ncbi:MAG: hypothetical protein P8R04_02480, partial [Gammaproteobacteria bacterium]|nr:hypothetical protein [Gammaproteobacteria bacterium]